MDASTTKPAPTPDEVWADKPDMPQAVIELLVATAEEYQLDLWINGRKVHSATVGPEEESDGPPK